MSLIDVNEINEALGIDLQSKIGKGQNNTTYTMRWIQKREDEILLLIAGHCWGGTEQAIRYTKNQRARDIIKEAIIDQVEYMLDNESIEKLGGIILSPNGVVQTLSKEQRMDAEISPRAYERLLNEGLLNANR